MKLPWSWNFIYKMHNRVKMSHYKYEEDLFSAKSNPVNFRDELKNARYRMMLYENTGNSEYLIDAANFLMFEYMEMNGKFIPTDSDEKSIIV